MCVAAKIGAGRRQFSLIMIGYKKIGVRHSKLALVFVLYILTSPKRVPNLTKLG